LFDFIWRMFALPVIFCDYSADRGKIGRLWKYLPSDKTFYKHLEYLNSFCLAIVVQRRKEPTTELQQRADLLSKMLVSKKVGLLSLNVTFASVGITFKLSPHRLMALISRKPK
jgi:hypothetical protein